MDKRCLGPQLASDPVALIIAAGAVSLQEAALPHACRPRIPMPQRRPATPSAMTGWCGIMKIGKPARLTATFLRAKLPQAIASPATPFFEATKNEKPDSVKLRICRLDLPGFRFGRDYGEFFDGLS